MTIEQFDRGVLVGAVVLLLCVAAVRVSTRTGLPFLLLYVGLGVALGEDGLGIQFDDARLTRVLGYAALVVILAEGGLTTSWPSIRRAVPAAATLATVGSLVSVGVTAIAAYFLLDRDWGLALLLGAVVSSTDAAAVFAVLRRVPLPPRLAGMLEAESGMNDAPIVILVVAFAEAETSGLDLGALALELVAELTVGAVVGLAVGWAGAQAMRRIALPSSGLYPIAVLGLAGGAYGAGSVLHGSGFLAVYLAALVLGNSHLPHGPATRGFAEGAAWLAQIGLFVMLGLLVTPHTLGSAIGPAIVIGTVLLVLARPLSVLVSVWPFGVPLREQAFLSWAGLRGAVPIVLATVPVVEQVPRSELVFNVVFVLVVVFTLVQAPTLPWVARRLGVSRAGEPADVAVEASPLGSFGADLLQLRIPADSHLAGVAIFELRLPARSVVTLVVRDRNPLVPQPITVLRPGDELLIVTPSDERRQVENRLRAVSRRGRLASWHGEAGAE